MAWRQPGNKLDPWWLDYQRVTRHQWIKTGSFWVLVIQNNFIRDQFYHFSPKQDQAYYILVQDFMI